MLAKYPAPKPLSIFTTDTPLAQEFSIGEGSHTPASAMSLSEEITMLRKRVKEQDKEIRRLKEENEFLEEASAFFAASRRKSAKTRE